MATLLLFFARLLVPRHTKRPDAWTRRSPPSPGIFIGRSRHLEPTSLLLRRPFFLYNSRGAAMSLFSKSTPQFPSRKNMLVPLTLLRKASSLQFIPTAFFFAGSEQVRFFFSPPFRSVLFLDAPCTLTCVPMLETILPLSWFNPSRIQ